MNKSDQDNSNNKRKIDDSIIWSEEDDSKTNDLRANALIDCTKFGVPQARKRIVILGVNKNLIKESPQIALHDFYKFIFPKYQTKKVSTVRDAINDLPKWLPLDEPVKVSKRKFSHAYEVCEIANHEPRMHSKRDIETFELLTREEAKNKIPDQYKKSVKVIKEGKEKIIDLSLKSYFGHELFLKTYDTKLTINYKKDFKRQFSISSSYLEVKKIYEKKNVYFFLNTTLYNNK